jgi:hypothetical protein
VPASGHRAGLDIATTVTLRSDASAKASLDWRNSGYSVDDLITRCTPLLNGVVDFEPNGSDFIQTLSERI